MRRILRFFTLGLFLTLSADFTHASPACAPAGENPAVTRLSDKLLTTTQLEPLLAKIFQQLYPEYEYVSPVAACELWSSGLGELFLPKTILLRFRSADNALPSVELVVSDSGNANAIALPADEDSDQPAQIILSRALLGYLSDRSELAFVIAHEMAHIRHDHFPLLPPFLLTDSQLRHISDVHKGWEIEADREALRLLEARRMSLEAPVRVLRRLEAAEEREADTEHAESHPPMSERIAAIARQLSGS